MKNGVVYITFKKNPKSNSIKELKHSVKSVKKMYPNLSITLFTDEDPKIKEIDNVRIVNVNSERVKQEYLYDSPYHNTLYLDCDTEIIGPIDELFGLTERFDISATHDLIRKDDKKSVVYPDYAKIPDGFPEYGGGVMLFRKVPVVENFFKVWRKNYNVWYRLTKEVRDQPSFRVSLWQCSDLHVHTLPPEFNIRTKNYNNIVPRINHQHNLWRKR